MKEINWEFNVGDIFENDKRNIVIVGKEIRQRTMKKKDGKNPCTLNEKWYKYKCLECSNEDYITEGHLKAGNGCNTCGVTPKKIVLGINTIWDKARWMCDLGVLEEDAKKYTPQHSESIVVVCPHCGNKKKCQIRNIYNNHSIGCICSDKQSYPEKFVYSILKQLDMEFQTQYSPKWAERRRYDFYIPNLNLIIEVHGEQHYNYTGRGRSLEAEQENDKIKEEKALDNKIEHYVIIDCRKSEIDWIKNNVVNSELNNLFDLNSIDWNECFRFACENNLVKTACEYKKNNPNMTYTEIGKMMGYERHSVKRWLEKGRKINWI